MSWAEEERTGFAPNDGKCYYCDKAYDIGYKEGAEDVINRVSNWLDEDTIQSLREDFLNE